MANVVNTDLVRNTMAESQGLEVRMDDAVSWFRDDYHDEIYAHVRPRIPWGVQRFSSNVASIRDRPELMELYRRELNVTARKLRGRALAIWLTDSALGLDPPSDPVVVVAPEVGEITMSTPHSALVVDALADLLLRWAGGDQELAERVGTRLLERARG